LFTITPDEQVRTIVARVDDGAGPFNRATDALPQPGTRFKLPVSLADLGLGLKPETLVSAKLVIGVLLDNDAATPMPDGPSGRIPVDIWDTLMEASQRADAESAIVRAATKPAAITSSAPAQCKIRPCSQLCRSTPAFDCTFQMYRGGRQICSR